MEREDRCGEDQSWPWPKLLRRAQWDTILHDGTHYWSIVALGALGAVLSFSIGTLRTSRNARIHELASGNYVTIVARVSTGSAAALVVTVAVETQVLSAPVAWVPALAVVAGFSERLVRRIVESVSGSVERPAGDPGG
jgi:hypothetical protein